MRGKEDFMNKISYKIFLVFILMLGMLIASSISGTVATNTQAQHILLTEVLGQKQILVERVTSYTKHFTELKMIESTALAERGDEIEILQAQVEEVETMIRELAQMRYPLEDGTIYELSFSAEFEEAFVESLNNNLETWQMISKNMNMITDADMVNHDELEAFYYKVIDVNDLMIDQSMEVVVICREAADSQKAMSDIIQISSLGIGLLIFLFLIYYITSNFYQPLKHIKETLINLSKGNLKKRFKRTNKDEFKEVYDGFNMFLNSLNHIFEIENNIIKEAELEKLLQLMSRDMKEFIGFSTIGLVYSKYDGKVIHLRFNDPNLIREQFVDNIETYDEISTVNGNLVIPIKLNQVNLGYYYFESYEAIMDDSNVVELVRDKLTMAFYKNILVKDLLNIITEALADTTEARDPETGDHLIRMSNYSQLVAISLQNTEKYRDVIDNNFIENILITAPMHDIGKIGIPDDILLKPGRLTDEEFDVMKTHAAHGGKILTTLDQKFRYYGINYFKMASDIAYGHHEKFDGSGYPNHLKGDEINLEARIIAIADVFDALTSKRPYKEAFSLEKSYAIIKESKGTHFDPDIVDAFFAAQPEIEKVYGVYKDV